MGIKVKKDGEWVEVGGGGGSSSLYTYPGGVSQTIQARFEQYVSVKDFGAVGDGVTDDTVAIQAALDVGGQVIFPKGTYAVTRNVQGDNRYGIIIRNSNTSISGHNAEIKRLDPDISTYAKAFAVLQIGKGDTSISNVQVNGIIFTGNNTYHADNGDIVPDMRFAVAIRNTSGVKIENCRFTNIDSQAIASIYPQYYNYTTSSYYNNTVNRYLTIDSCIFNALPHSVPGRAIVHAIGLSGVNGAIVSNCSSTWCDDFLSSSSTFDNSNQTINDTYVITGNANSSANGTWLRSGTDLRAVNNYCYNSSEHAFYVGTRNSVVSSNTVTTDNPTVCISDIKFRGLNQVISNNNITGGGISISEGSGLTSITGNVVDHKFIEDGLSSSNGAISISASNLKSYIDKYPFLTYQQMGPINISDNQLKNIGDLPTTSLTQCIGIRVVSTSTSSNAAVFPNSWSISTINITGNTITNFYNGLFGSSAFFRGGVFSDNIVSGYTDTDHTAKESRAAIAVSNGGGGFAVNCFDSTVVTGNVFTNFQFLAATTSASPSNISFWCKTFTGNSCTYLGEINASGVRTGQEVKAFTYNTFTSIDTIDDNNFEGSAAGNLVNGTVRNGFVSAGNALRYYDADGTYTTVTTT